MSQQSTTVREALEQHYRRAGLPRDGGIGRRRWAPLPTTWLKLPNFAWRQRALPVHYVHHVLLGYPCTPAGEFQMAAWEFAAGRFRHPLATAFCLPLVGLGAVVQPRRTFAAFVRGRASQTLYASGLTPAVLGCSVESLRKTILPAEPVRPMARDVLAYLGWVSASIVWMVAAVAPVVLLVSALWAAR